MKASSRLFLLIVLLVAARGAMAILATDEASIDARVASIAQELRCLVCQNQTIGDSNAGLAIDLRNQIRKQIADGASDDAVRAYMVERYGDFVLYRPPVKRITWLLWFGPAVLVAGAAVVFSVVVRRRRIDDGEVQASLPEAQISGAPFTPGEES